MEQGAIQCNQTFPVFLTLLAECIHVSLETLQVLGMVVGGTLGASTPQAVGLPAGIRKFSCVECSGCER